MTNRRKKTLGWSIQQRGNTWYLYHRLTPTGKQIGVTTKETDRELALAKAIQMIKAIRLQANASSVISDYSGVLNDDSRSDNEKRYINDLVKNEMATRLHSISSNLDDLATQEESILLGKYQDKTNPRLTTLWDFDSDRGLLPDFLKSQDKSPASIVKHRAILRPFFAHLADNGVERAESIRQGHIVSHFDAIAGDYHQNTLHSIETIIRHLLRYLDDQYGIKIAFPKLNVRTTNIPTSKEIGVLTEEQISAITGVLSEFDCDLYLRLFLLGLNTGMRRAEYTNLLWDNVFLNAPKPYINVRTNDADASKGIARSYLKTRRSSRRLPIRASLLAEMKQWHAERDPDCPYVLRIPPHKDRSKYRLPYSVESAIRAVVPNFHLHILRHTFISRALLVGKVPPVEVAQWVGDTVAEILNTYSHFIDTGNVDNW